MKIGLNVMWVYKWMNALHVSEFLVRGLNVAVKVVIRTIHEMRIYENVGCVEFMTQTSITVLCVYFVDSSRLNHSDKIQFSSDFSK